MHTILPKTETIKLVESTTPIENILQKDRTQYQKSFDKRMEIQFWYLKFKIGTNDPIRTHWKALEKLLGHKIQIYRTYEFKSAIWGFEYKGTKFLIWKSKRGTDITVLQNEPVKKVFELLNYLHTLMGYPWMKEMEKKVKTTTP